MTHEQISRRGRPGAAKKCTKKCATRAKLLFWLSNVLLFWRLCCRRRRRRRRRRRC